jgi:hypothetical protein
MNGQDYKVLLNNLKWAISFKTNLPASGADIRPLPINQFHIISVPYDIGDIHPVQFYIQYLK